MHDVREANYKHMHALHPLYGRLSMWIVYLKVEMCLSSIVLVEIQRGIRWVSK